MRVSFSPSLKLTGTRLPMRQPFVFAKSSARATPWGPTLARSPWETFMSYTPATAAGSATVKKSASEPSFIGAKPRPAAVSTSGSSPMERVRSGLMPASPQPDGRTTRSPPKERSTLWSTDALMEAPITVKIVTTATPTISEAAVPEVRRGLRTAFSRARRPVMPRSRAGSIPRMRPAGRAATGPKTTRPTIISTEPRPLSARAPSPSPATPPSTAATPAAASTAPSTARTVELPVRSSDTSRMAASGGMREPRTAGRNPATKVTTMPTTSGATIAARRDDETTGRDREPEGGEPGLQTGTHGDAEAQPDDRRDRADHEGLRHRREQHLAAARADRP